MNSYRKEQRICHTKQKKEKFDTNMNHFIYNIDGDLKLKGLLRLDRGCAINNVDFSISEVFVFRQLGYCVYLMFKYQLVSFFCTQLNSFCLKKNCSISPIAPVN